MAMRSFAVAADQFVGAEKGIDGVDSLLSLAALPQTSLDERHRRMPNFVHFSLRADNDVDIVSQMIDGVKKPFHREAGRTPADNVRNVRLRHTDRVRGLSLRHLPVFDNRPNPQRECHFGVAFIGVGQAQRGEVVVAADDERLLVR